MTALLVILSSTARADELADAAGLEQLTEVAEAYLGGYLQVEDLTGADFSRGAAAILTGGLGDWRKFLSPALRSGVLLVGVALFCGLAESMRESLHTDGLDPVRLAGATAVMAIAATDVQTLLGLGSKALADMDAFSKLLLPTVTAICAASGAATTAVAGQGAVLLFMGLLLTLADRIFLPLVYAYTAVQTASAALGNDGLKRLGNFLKWCASGVLSLLVTGFVIYLSVTGTVAGNTDVMTRKAAKTAISNMIPVVGKILADSAEAMVAGAGVLKGTVGVIGLLTVLAICFVPFLRLGIQYLTYKCAALLAVTVFPSSITGLIENLGSAFALVLAVVGSGGMILYVALITSIKAVAG